jgi:hypothetical protein
MNTKQTETKRPVQDLRRAEDVVLIAVCCVTMLVLLTLVGAGAAAFFGAL